MDDAEDNVVLSKRRADMHKVWSELERLHAAGEPITAEVTQVVKGLLVDLCALHSCAMFPAIMLTSWTNM